MTEEDEKKVRQHNIRTAGIIVFSLLSLVCWGVHARDVQAFCLAVALGLAIKSAIVGLR